MRHHFYFLILLISMCLTCVSFGKGTYNETITRERGFFSIDLMFGYQENRILNQDNSYSSYKGQAYGAGLDIRLFGEGSGELHLFGSLSKSDTTDSLTSENTFSRSESLLGLKAYVSSNFFLAAAYGESSQTIKTSAAEASVRNNVLAAGLGLEFPISQSLALGVHGWYKNNPIRNEGDVQNTSFSDGFDAFVVLIWSPPSATIIQYSK